MRNFIDIVESTFSYKQDNPAVEDGEAGREWLEDARADAEAAPARYKLLTGKVTARMGPVYLPVDVVSKIPGARDEQRKSGEGQFDHLMAKVEEFGFDSDHEPILIGVNHRGEAYIVEGNTRVAVAKHLGIPYIAAMVKWFNGAEMEPSKWKPDYLASIAKQASDGVSSGVMENVSKRRRKHSLYLSVISEGPLVIVRLPDEFLPWREARQRIFDFMKRDVGVKVKDIFAIEGIAGYPEGEKNNDDPLFIEKCEQAFAGSPDYLSKFILYAWDPASRTFKLARKAIS